MLHRCPCRDGRRHRAVATDTHTRHDRKQHRHGDEPRSDARRAPAGASYRAPRRRARFGHGANILSAVVDGAGNVLLS